jgi:hypothetical protein
MNICSCGNLFNDQYSQCPRCDALQVFGLGRDATETEIRNAYRTLVKVWQPDRILDDQKLKEEAENKLKDINTAFESLIATSTELIGRQRPVYLTSRAASSETVPDAENAPRKPSQGFTTLVVLPERTPPPPPGFWQRMKPRLKFWSRFGLICVIAAFAILILSGRSIRTLLNAHRPGVEQPASVNGQQSAPNATEGPSNDSPVASKQNSQSPGRPNSVRNSAQASNSAQPANERAAAHGTQPEARKMSSYLTVGSTKDEVLAQLGTPTASSDDKLVYGKSELYLKDGAVVGWRIDPVSSPIRVKLWPEAPVDPGLDFFSYGSSRDAVLAVQGTPTAFSEDKFEYGGSVVYFQNKRVVSWKNDPASIPLRLRPY